MDHRGSAGQPIGEEEEKLLFAPERCIRYFFQRSNGVENLDFWSLLECSPFPPPGRDSLNLSLDGRHYQ